ncbi:M48 family metalloprotease [Vibrio gallicus]|uniref:M48 family metalloprotease n=1 Tax=Vibrio gallicus TaxID=190897 RepID=UPI0021C300E6|nr:M48 family metalloprotease [Vibrio gallicus]
MLSPLNIYKPVLIVGASFSLISCAVSTDYDREVGAQNAQIVEQQMGVYTQGELDQYVQQIGDRLVSHIENPEFEFHFKVVDDPVPNAFALPGGYIFVSRGLLSLVNSEDELACVIGHEIIHVTERHSVKQMRSGVLPGLVELPGDIIGGVINEDLGNFINSPIHAGNQLLMAGYSRSHETEADRKGIALAAKAGYDPMAMNSILIRLHRTVEIQTKQNTEKSYFDSHPYTPDRVATVSDEAKTLTVAELAPIHPQFIPYLDGMLMGENPSKGLFQGHTFLHPELKFAIDFPEGWQLGNQPTAVGAVDEKQDAAVILGSASNEFTAKEYALRFQSEVKKQYGTELPIEEQQLSWGKPYYSVTLEATRDKHKSYLTRGWVNLGTNTYQIIAIASEDKKGTVHKSVTSFRPLTDEQLASITKHQLKIVSLKKGQALESLLKLNRSSESVELTEVMNDIDKGQSIEAQKEVKIVVERPYK